MSTSTDPAALSLAIEAIRQRCRDDMVFFATKYLYTRDEHDKANPKKKLPNLPYIRFLLEQFQRGPKLLYIAKSRQMMVSWLLSVVALHTAMFRPLSTVLFQSKKEEDAAKMIYQDSIKTSRATFMFLYLPEFLRGCYDADGQWLDISDVEHYFVIRRAASAGKLVFPNGSVIKALAQGASQIESWSPALFINDEASLQDEWVSAQAAAQPALDKDSRGITVGTMRLPSDYGDEISPCDLVDPDGVMRGVAEFKTKNSVYGIRLHYTADPAKDPLTTDGQLWRRELLESGAFQGGEQGWRWQQHMEINPRSRSGEICIPPLLDDDARSRIVIPDYSVERMLAERWAFDAGFDWGARNNTVWLIMGINPRGERFIVHELSAPAQTLGGVPGVAAAMKKHPLFERVNGMIHADPSIWNTDQNMVGGMVSKADLFAEYGVHLSKAEAKGQHADDVTLQRLLYYYWDGWQNPRSFRPMLYIFSSCTNTIENWQLLRYEEWSEMLAPEKAKKETMKQKNQDEFDAFKYAEVAWPDLPHYTAPAVTGSLKWFKNQAKIVKNRPPSENNSNCVYKTSVILPGRMV